MLFRDVEVLADSADFIGGRFLPEPPGVNTAHIGSTGARLPQDASTEPAP